MIKYRKVRKYMLHETYSVQTPIKPAEYIHEPKGSPFIELSPTGMLTVKAGYTWDGPSGPAFDTPNFMRGSLVHDALYQLMRTGRLAQKWRKNADQMMHRICKEAGMSSLRAWWCVRGVRRFAGFAAKRQEEESYKVITAP